MSVPFSHAWVLFLLPAALLPVLRAHLDAAPYSWLDLIPADPISGILGWLVRAAGALAIASTIVGLAGPYSAEATVERIGKGAQVVVLLDRSRSMDQAFAFGAHALDESSEAKGKAAQRLLADFAGRRPQDLFGMVVFSSTALRILEFTQSQEAIQAAILASQVGRGLTDTDVGRGVLTALSFFDDRPYTASRIILLVSDGGARLDEDTRREITQKMKRHRVALYWLYLRSYGSPGLLADATGAESNDETVPEHALHKFFLAMGTHYRAYEAENPDSLQRAVDDVGRLESLPIHIQQVHPRQDRASWFYALALGLVLLLAGVKLMELRLRQGT